MSKVTKLLNKIQKLWDLEQPALYDASEDLVAKYADDLQALRIHTGIVYPSQVSDLLDSLYGSPVPEYSIKDDLPSINGTKLSHLLDPLPGNQPQAQPQPYAAYRIRDYLSGLNGMSIDQLIDSVLGTPSCGCSNGTTAKDAIEKIYGGTGFERTPVNPNNQTRRVLPLIVNLGPEPSNEVVDKVNAIIKSWRDQQPTHQSQMEEHAHQGEVTQEVTTGSDQQETSLHVHIRNDGTILLDRLHIGKLPEGVPHGEVMERIRELIGELYPVPKIKPSAESYSAAPSLIKPEEYNPEAAIDHYINRKIQLLEHFSNLQSQDLDWSNLFPFPLSKCPVHPWDVLMQPEETKDEPQPEFNMNTRSPYGDFKVLTSNGWISINELGLMNPGDHVFIVGFDPRSTK